MEFTEMVIIKQKICDNLPVNLWFYTDISKRDIYMQNNYHKYTTGDDLVPISIDKENPILLEDVEIMIRKEDFEKVKEFIKKYYKELNNLVQDDLLDYHLMDDVWINKFKPTFIDGFIIESLPIKCTKLPVNLYLYCNGISYDDERNRYSLLMQNAYNHRYPLVDAVTVSIDKKNPKLLYDVSLKITEEDFEKVKEFIRQNYEILSDYTENKIDFEELYYAIKNR